MKLTRIALVAITLLTISAEAFAQDTTSVVVPKSLLTADQVARLNASKTNKALETADKVVAIGKSTGWGKEIGEGVNGALSALTTNADNFAKTGVGKFTMWMVAFKVLGNQAIRLLLALLVMATITTVFVWMWRDNFTNRRHLKKHTLASVNSPEIKEYEIIEVDSSSQEQRAVYAAIWIVIMLIAIAVGGC